MFVKRVSWVGAGLCGSIGALILSACSQEPGRATADVPSPPPIAIAAQSEPAANAVAERVDSSEAGVRIFVDPATGAIREPTVEEEAAVARGEAAQPVNKPTGATHIREVHLPDGSTAVIPDQAPPEYLQACTRSDDQVAVAHACIRPLGPSGSAEPSGSAGSRK